ncbi:MAG: response regulator transcription factor, partial [Kiritimatiellae bacterium]|nr:response regulator transcription factor [Kiritimatiellia bacterium]
MDKIRVLLADDHEMIRMGLVSILETVPNIKIVGEAENGAVAVSETLRLKPDVVLMDVLMPRKDGIAATVEIKRKSPETKIILLTSTGSSDDIARGIQAGASGAILKSADFSALISTITTVANGGTAISQEVQQLLAMDPPVADLSERQSEILHSIFKGLSDPDIAKLLGISVYTVKEHINLLFNKLGAANRTEAVAIALRKHLLKI